MSDNDFKTLQADLTSPAGRTECAAATRFATEHGESVRYCFMLRKWLVCEMRVWRFAKQSEMETLAQKTVNKIWTDAIELAKQGNVDSYLQAKKFAAQLSNRYGLRAILQLAKCDDRIAIRKSEAEQLIGGIGAN